MEKSQPRTSRGEYFSELLQSKVLTALKGTAACFSLFKPRSFPVFLTGFALNQIFGVFKRKPELRPPHTAHTRTNKINHLSQSVDILQEKSAITAKLLRARLLHLFRPLFRRSTQSIVMRRGVELQIITSNTQPPHKKCTKKLAHLTSSRKNFSDIANLHSVL